MSELLVLYKSKYGSTKKYVQWLQEETGCDVFPAEEYKNGDFSGYSTVIFAGGIYAGGIAGLSVLKKNLRSLSGKYVAVLAVGASPFDQKAFDQVKAQNMRGLPEGIPVFYARGAYDEKKMSLKDRTLCRMLKKTLAGKELSQLEPWQQALMEAGDEGHDWTDSKELVPLLKYLKEPEKALR